MSGTPFPLRVDHHPDEPAHGLLLRTAEHNGTRRYYPLFVRFGVSHSFRVNNVDPEAVATACKADPKSVARASPVTTPKTVDLLGQQMHRDHYSVHRRRWCPECLKADPYHRAWWDVVAITTCPTHKVELVTDCGCSKRATWQSFGIAHCGAGHDLREASTAAVDDDELVVDQYLVSRLTGVDQVPHSLLDDMAFGEVVLLLERLGKAWHDHSADLRKLRSEIGTRKLLAAGYQIVADFPAGFRSLLDRMVKDAGSRRGEWGINKLYGEFYYWVQQLPASVLADALRAEITDHGEANTKIKTGTKLFDGRNIDNGYTLEEAAAIVGVARGKLRRMAIELGLIAAKKQPGQPVRLDRDKIHNIANTFRGSTTLSEVAAELDIGLDAAHSLVAAGMLTPLLRAGQSGLNNYDFAATSVQDLLDRLVRVPVVEDGGQRQVPLPQAAQQARITVAHGLKLVMDGIVAVISVDQAAVGLQRYLVSPSSIVRAARAKKQPGLTLRAAADRLELPYNATTDFVNRGVIDAIVEGRGKFVTEAEIARFRETYVTVPELSQILGTTRPRDTIAILAGAGVEPACPRPPYWKVLYWRKEAVAAVKDLDPTPLTRCRSATRAG